MSTGHQRNNFKLRYRYPGVRKNSNIHLLRSRPSAAGFREGHAVNPIAVSGNTRMMDGISICRYVVIMESLVVTYSIILCGSMHSAWDIGTVSDRCLILAIPSEVLIQYVPLYVKGAE